MQPSTSPHGGRCRRARRPRAPPPTPAVAGEDTAGQVAEPARSSSSARCAAARRARSRRRSAAAPFPARRAHSSLQVVLLARPDVQPRGDVRLQCSSSAAEVVAQVHPARLLALQGALATTVATVSRLSSSNCSGPGAEAQIGVDRARSSVSGARIAAAAADTPTSGT